MEKNEKFYTVRGYELKIDEEITASMEDYLEMIYRCTDDNGFIRIGDLSEKLNVKPSSATKMVQKMAELSLLVYKKYGIIILTPKGKSLGKYLLNRHNIIEKFLKNIGIKEDILMHTELIEHSIDKEIVKKLDKINTLLFNDIELKRKIQEL